MEELMEAIKANDLVAVRKIVSPLLQERVSSLIESLKEEIASSVMIEGEEPKKSDDPDEDDPDEDDDEDDE